MEFTQVRYFLALARSLNFTRAAEACNVTQPALTKAIQKLEDELGGPLFRRERSLTQLTELGQLMLPHLEQSAAAAEAAKSQARAFGRREAAPLRLGVDPTIAIDALSPVLGELAARLPGFDLGLRQEPTPTLFDLMLASELDAGLVVERARIPDRFNRWPLFEERLVVICPPGHALAARDDVALADLEGQTLLGRNSPDCAYAEYCRALAESTGLDLAPRPAAPGEEAVQALVRAGLGVALAGARQPIQPGLRAVPLRDDAATRRILLVVVAGRPYGPGLAGFLKLMRARDWSGVP